MTDDWRQETGEWGEEQAAAWLEAEKGMRVLARRWRSGRGELDLVMRLGEVMVFVEVRVRTGEANRLAAYQSIRAGKWRVLRRTAMAYVRASGWRPAAARFDVVGVRRTRGGRLVDITHWENLGTLGRDFRF